MRPYNLGYGGGISIGQIVDTIVKVSELNPEVVWDDSKPQQYLLEQLVLNESKMNWGLNRHILLKKV
jgi:UDP-glucose 4-epimerase